MLRNGQLVGEFTTAELPRVQLVAKMMGKDFDDLASIKGDTAKEFSENYKRRTVSERPEPKSPVNPTTSPLCITKSNGLIYPFFPSHISFTGKKGCVPFNQ